MTESPKAIMVLAMNTVAFTVCFACWMMNGVWLLVIFQRFQILSMFQSGAEKSTY